MEGFIDKLAGILRGLFGCEEIGAEKRPPGNARFTDPDIADAWEELDDFLSTGAEEGRWARGNRARGPSPNRSSVDEALRRDYANLEVPFGADIDEVKKAYKTLILRYHPDKHSDDPERQRIALEITKKINESFERIKKG